MTETELNSLSGKVIGCCYAISNTLGSGFLEKVYQNALAHELRKLGLKVEIQKPLYVIYDSVVVGEYFADLLIEDVLIIELKACDGFNEVHKAQCLNYLNSTRLPLCLLINFGRPKVEIKRIFQSQYLENIA
ncbi:MAG TPA: GxxExxY protein [Pyrinomonadaceae bacterium]|nr:GxxExxY protein [Pyrinomonadaceae bacterium]